MMNIRTASGFYAHFHGKLIRVKHIDGTDWIGVVTGLPEYPDKADPEDQPVIFMRVRRLAAYKKNSSSYKGASTLLWPGDTLEIHQL